VRPQRLARLISFLLFSHLLLSSAVSPNGVLENDGCSYLRPRVSLFYNSVFLASSCVYLQNSTVLFCGRRIYLLRSGISLFLSHQIFNQCSRASSGLTLKSDAWFTSSGGPPGPLPFNKLRIQTVCVSPARFVGVNCARPLSKFRWD